MPVPIMVRKNRTGPGGSGETSGEASGASGQGPSQRTERTQQHGGGRGWVPQQGGRGSGQYQGRGGHYQGRGPGSHHHGGGQPEYHPREYQARGGPRPRGGGMPQPYYGGHRGGGVGRSVPPGPSRTVPELHQAPYVQYQAPMVSPSPLGPGSSSQPAAEVSSGHVQQQFQQLAIRGQTSTGQEMQLAPASSKSVRFPLRPGKGTYGDRCIVKANHFFAELPDKDLHQYDVRSS
jgi:eukaryotic translation initiation factor 2C